MRDKRDPQKLGEVYQAMRKDGFKQEMAVDAPVEDFADDGFISTRPWEHHTWKGGRFVSEKLREELHKKLDEYIDGYAAGSDATRFFVELS